jgi:choline dehydrogenase-like flavoprotein
MTENTDVVVIGGGYAGVMSANRLTQRVDVTVTLINPRPSFVERIRLHQVVGGSDDTVVDYRDVLAKDIRLVVDTVTRINADRAQRDVGDRRHGRLRLPDLRGGECQRPHGGTGSGRVRLPDGQPGGGAADSDR